MNVLGVIPARYSSTRLPGKPLKDICGKPMIQHVYERTCESELLDRVIVATDDDRIVNAVNEFGGEAVLTLSDHKSGSDRIAEVAENIDCNIVVNIQGDEPLIQAGIIDEITRELVNNESLPMSTGCYRISEADYYNPNVVKVVRDKNGNALYFSRSLIPYPREAADHKVYEHIGVYAFRKEFLMKYITFESTPLFESESLEQLKVLENGYRIRVVETRFDYNALSVDTEEDLERVIRIIKQS